MNQAEQIEFLRRNTSFGCMTRQALELDLMHGVVGGQRMSIVYWDLDGLHDANERIGEEIVNMRVRSALTRNLDRVYSWFSGDEFVAFVYAVDAFGFTKRIQTELRAQGLRATFCIVDCGVPENSIKMALSRVKVMKKGNWYGKIDDLRTDALIND